MSPVRLAIRVSGVVQGVGYRPFVHALATRLGLAGHVGNDASGVFIEVEGVDEAVDVFVAGLRSEAPPLAVVESVRSASLAVEGEPGFRIVPSPAGGTADTLISADSTTCADCLRELWDPADRRYRYPFINCTHCGPRFTIVRGVPYDRPLTTMAGFALCAECAAEYADPADRRFHAQPVCCPACGPRLFLDGVADPLASTVEFLAAGKIVAIKGLGGYHLAVDAGSDDAAALLRSRKHREDKPFAIMVPDLAAARTLCTVDDVAASMLTSRRRPIVLLPRLPDAAVAPAVSPGNRRLGLMLPYTPLHHLLLADLGRPIVLTSANISDEPIVYRDDEVTRLSGIADAILSHDRPIHMRTDDSVVRPFRGREQVQRRSRGYVPEPLGVPFTGQVLACGAELKNTFCLAKGGHAFLSHHIGDLENYETLRSFVDGIEHFRRLFDIHPGVVAHDLHPEYLSTKYALELPDVEQVSVQHHHAHIASCLADNGAEGPVLGVAFDGTGYGPDGTIWGGEFLLADYFGFSRLGHLEPVPMPGGAAAIRSPWRMALAYLGSDAPSSLVSRHVTWSAVSSMAHAGVNSPLTSSAGRLFDAVASVVGLRDVINYEGQAAIELEQIADLAEPGAYPVRVVDGDPVRVFGVDLVRAAAADSARAGVVSARFHRGLADAVVRACSLLRERTSVGVVALSGGVFQNCLFSDLVVTGLEASGFTVLTHSRVPTNDGGVSLGQAVIAGVSLRS
ncbi:hydrogenase maturation protein HypF [Amycolatopsis xylanica]|uniref:Carbamoyltransferase n=1 Tax=Amycolatopsis xylanica TaxID=589385 RepID=A0A1H3G8X6_9PSEU|nr:carbamoyltransferase HypF [Amycolatopsis xylanica]SDX98944.1 hydrogenase maturation protein HypF [Amycolatopsis xylanica]